MVSQTKQVKRLKKDAQRLWSDQQALLNRANGVARDAVPHAKNYAGTVYGSRLAPTVAKVAPTVAKGAVAGKAAGTYVGSTARDAVQGTLVPAVSSAVAAALALAEEGSSRIGLAGADTAKKAGSASKKLNTVTKAGEAKQVKAKAKLKAAGKAGKLAAKAGSKRIQKSSGSKSGLGAGGIVGIILGVGLLAGIGYAVWQTLRADDDLWVADEDPEITPTSDAPTV